MTKKENSEAKKDIEIINLTPDNIADYGCPEEFERRAN